MSHAVATIQFVLHSFKQSTASLTKDRVLKMKSVLLSVVFIALLPSVPRTRRIWLYGRRQKKQGKQQSTKSEKFIRNILVSLWPLIEGALSITIYNNDQILVFFRNHAFIYILFFQRKVISYRRSLCEAARKLDCYREMELKDDWEPTENKPKSS